jgi:hypothetical protein
MHSVENLLRSRGSVFDTQQMLSNSENNVTTAKIEWDIVLRIRYPSPVVKRDFGSIHVLAPQLVDGFLQSKSTDTNCSCWTGERDT